MPELEIHHYLLLFLAGGLGGFVDSIAGGGGLISVPAFLSVGLPPHLALGTTKLQSSFGSVTASIRYARKGLVDLKQVPIAILFTAIGAGMGTVALQSIQPDFLKNVVMVMLTMVFTFTLFSKNLGKETNPHRIPHTLYYLIFGLTLGFYDGFFGPGTGSFWTLAFIILLGFDLKQATGHTKVVNATSNLVALLFFLAYGQVVFAAGLVMGAGQLIGAWCGSHLVIHKGTGFIRAFFLTVVGLTLLRMLWITYISS